MQRGPRPKPTALKLVQGNPGKRPLPENEPQVIEPVGGPPADWAPEAKALWWEIVNSAPATVLTAADRALVEIAVRLLATLRSSPAVNPQIAAQLRTCLNEMGMSPGSRARLSVPTAPKGNPFDRL